MAYSSSVVAQALSLCQVEELKANKVLETLSEIQPLTSEVIAQEINRHNLWQGRELCQLSINNEQVKATLSDNTAYSFEVYQNSLVRCVEKNLILSLDCLPFYLLTRSPEYQKFKRK